MVKWFSRSARNRNRLSSVKAMIEEEDEQRDDEQEDERNEEQEQEEEEEGSATEEKGDDENKDSAAEDNEEDEESEAGEDEGGCILGKRPAASSGHSWRKKSAAWVPPDPEDEEVNPTASPPNKKSARTAKEYISSDGGEPLFSSPLISQTLACIRKARHHITHRQESIMHPFPESYIPELRKLRSAALDLLNCTDDAISCAHRKQAILEKLAVMHERAIAQKELKKVQSEYTLQVSLLKEARLEREKQKVSFQKEKTTLQAAHDVQKTAMLPRQRALLERLLEEEKDKTICWECYDKPQDTIILPCLHTQYCFGCLLRHRAVNSNTCPSCRGPIQGLNMSTFLAGQ